MHEELGPGGRVSHHAVHHTDESLTLTHLQQRKEQTTPTQSRTETSPLHPADICLCSLSRGQQRASSTLLGLTYCTLLVNSLSGPALKLPLRKGHGRELGGGGPGLTALQRPRPVTHLQGT